MKITKQHVGTTVYRMAHGILTPYKVINTARRYGRFCQVGSDYIDEYDLETADRKGSFYDAAAWFVSDEDYQDYLRSREQLTRIRNYFNLNPRLESPEIRKIINQISKLLFGDE